MKSVPQRGSAWLEGVTDVSWFHHALNDELEPHATALWY